MSYMCMHIDYYSCERHNPGNVILSSLTFSFIFSFYRRREKDFSCDALILYPRQRCIFEIFEKNTRRIFSSQQKYTDST